MRIAVHGATGKVGRELVAHIMRAREFDLAGAFGSRRAQGELPDADVVIDFSAPAATMALLELLAGNPVALVIGTTGFSAAQMQRLNEEGERRPVLIGANFTLGFEPFRAAATAMALQLPRAQITVAETYNMHKKPVASGTTQGLVADLSATSADRTIATELNRVGDTPGINIVRFDLGTAVIELTLEVKSRAAYAAGALSAAQWLIGRPNGIYSPSDLL
ncbi:MAG: dihydrodipicolinate reductase [Notoacmeibacter sp.]|nr:dihydrodipicolinate reductase [Notoacmeibacter sp.]